MSDFIDWAGKSGRSYRYLFVVMSQPFKAVAGNYAFVKQLPTGKFLPLYFGETGDMSSRMPNHEVWDNAVRMGATHAMAHATQDGASVRCAEERDLIEFWNPPLNVQHRTAG